ncbi:6-bladed beta-propeller [Acidobacteriota bacterium]
MKKTICLVSILIFTSFYGPKQDVEKITEDGIEVVINHLDPYKIEGEPSILHLVKEISIDTEENAIAETGVTDVLDFCVDSEGNIYFRITMSPEDLVYKFDKNGKFLFSFGRRGQGPSELMSPKSLIENELGQIEISDSANSGLYFYDKSGEFIEKISLPQDFMKATLLRNGKILAIKRYFNKEEGRGERPIILCNDKYEVIRTLHSGKSFPNLQLAKTINPLEIYMDYNTYRMAQGHIYVGNYGSDYEFFIFDLEGKLIKKIRKDYQEIKVPKQIKEEVLSKAEELIPKDIIKKVVFPEFYPAFQFFFLDDEGRLYVMTYEKGEKSNSFIYDIFNIDGCFIANIELDNYGLLPNTPNDLPLPLNVVSKNRRIYCLREKESGFKELIVYKMKWE